MGGETSTAAAIDNEYTLLTVDDLGLPLNAASAESYTLGGACDDYSAIEPITVTAVGAGIQRVIYCVGDNDYSLALNLSALDSSTYPTVTIQVEYLGETKSVTINNEIVILAFADVQPASCQR